MNEERINENPIYFKYYTMPVLMANNFHPTAAIEYRFKNLVFCHRRLIPRCHKY